jgi:hypothetical protein
MNAIPDPPVPVNALREAVRRAVEASSLRTVANEVGVSHGAVVKFMDGAKPQARTVRKLLTWYLRQKSVAMDETTALAAIALLVGTYPEAHRDRVRERLLEVLRHAHGEAGIEIPDWMK